jgi:hypothetical protein
MKMRSLPDQRILRVTPICAFGLSSCAGALSHVYAGVDAYVALLVPWL